MTEQDRFNLEQEILDRLKCICSPPSHYPFDPEKVMEVEKEVMERKIQDNGVTLSLPRMFNDPDYTYTVFELTDAYLPISKEFEQFMPEHETYQKDKNKISFKMPILTDWNVHMLDFYWHGHCLKNKYWMKCCDIHKDNPTILYVP